MTRTFGQNSVGDIYIGTDGNLAVLSGLAAVEAACATATKAQLQEMVLATTSGIPNFQALWIGTPEYSLWRSYLLSTLQNVPGVEQVSSLTLSVSGNTVSYTAVIVTPLGTATITSAPPQATIANAYTTEDGFTRYVTEDGINTYIKDS